MLVAAALIAAVNLPLLPAALASACTEDKFTGVITTGRPSIVLTSSNISASGSATFKFSVGGYAPPATFEQEGPILAIQLDSQTTTYTTLRASDTYGSFEVGFSKLAPGVHMLALAFLEGRTDASTPYAKVCFSIR